MDDRLENKLDEREECRNCGNLHLCKMTLRMMRLLSLTSDYGERVVGRDDNEETGLKVSTARVAESFKPYETAVMHPAYETGGGWIIVEAYDTAEQAAEGHKRWLATMTAKTLPNQLADCCNCEEAVALRDNDYMSLIYEKGSTNGR